MIERDLKLKGFSEPVEISTIVAQEVAKLNPGGSAAQLRAKIDGNGQLGRVEVLDGGSLYDDSDGPILVTFLPPQPTVGSNAEEEQVEDEEDPEQQEPDPVDMAGQPVDNGFALAANVSAPVELQTNIELLSENPERKKGEMFFTLEKGSFLKKVTKLLYGRLWRIPPRELILTPAISSWRSRLGRMAKWSKLVKLGSDLETYQKDEQIYYEGQYYQALIWSLQ